MFKILEFGICDLEFDSNIPSISNKINLFCLLIYELYGSYKI